MTSIETLRKKIEEVDGSIIKNLAERQSISQKIGELKAAAGESIVDPNREKNLAQYHEKIGEIYHLPPDFIHRIFEIIIQESRKIQS